MAERLQVAGRISAGIRIRRRTEAGHTTHSWPGDVAGVVFVCLARDGAADAAGLCMSSRRDWRGGTRDTTRGKYYCCSSVSVEHVLSNEIHTTLPSGQTSLSRSCLPARSMCVATGQMCASVYPTEMKINVLMLS